MVGKSEKYLGYAEDVNGDGLLDLVCKVYTAQFMIEPGETIAVLEIPASIASILISRGVMLTFALSVRIFPLNV